jgi:glycosyltransferase involved in cell wall biosynthesis
MHKYLLINDFRHCGGAEIAFTNSAIALSRIKPGCVATYCHSCTPKPINLLLSPLNPSGFIRILFAAYRHQPNTIVIHNFCGAISPLGLAALFLYKALSPECVHIIVTMHDYSLLCPSPGHFIFSNGSVTPVAIGSPTREYMKGRLDNRAWPMLDLLKYLRWIILRLVLRIGTIDAYLSPSQFLIKAAVGRVPDNKVYFLPNAVIDERLVESSATYVNTRSNRSEAIILGFFGRNSPEKGLNLFVRELREARKSCTLRIYTDLTPVECKDLSEASGPMVTLEFMGSIDHSDIRQAMSSLNCVCVPSVWFENAPLVVSEALSVGCWVLVRNIGSLGLIAKQSHSIYSYTSTAELSKLLDSIPFTQNPQSTLPGERFSEHATGLELILQKLRQPA